MTKIASLPHFMQLPSLGRTLMALCMALMLTACGGGGSNPGTDATPPIVTITSPVSVGNTPYDTTDALVSLAGSTSDNVGVTQVSWNNNRGGSGTADGIATWSITNVPLQTGLNVINIIARDTAGNTGTATLTVNYSVAASDITGPAITINTPTNDAVLSTSASNMALAGSATDAGGINRVTWVSDRGGSGTAAGTTSWSVASIALQPGSNILLVTAFDPAGNTGTDVLTVVYVPPGPDVIAPTVTISLPTANATFDSGASAVDLAGSASDAVGVVQVTWSNDRGGSGIATGSTSWSVAGITLQPGVNIISLSASDAAGNLGTDLLAITYAIPACSSNAIVAENCRPGAAPSEWDVDDAGDPSIQGFATEISINRGSTIAFKVDTDASAYRFDIYRLGYYGGLGARKIDSFLPSATLPQSQPTCINEAATGLVDCGTWAISGTWQVPPAAVSGIYMARLVRTDTGGASQILFVVRNDQSNADLVYQTSDTTWQAYNDYGGNSLYSGSPAGRAYKVSYNRPLVTRGNQYRRASPFGAETPMIRWLESNGYDLTYISGADTDRSPQVLTHHKAFLSVGHDEYWSSTQRANVEAARNAGVHLAFFSGNEMFWKTRWEPSIDGSNVPYRTLVAYKETHANAKIDPFANVWTGTWRDARFSPPADGGRPENAVTGTRFSVNCCEERGIDIPAAKSALRFWRNTSVASLGAGQTASLNQGILGHEWDEAPADSAPPGLIRLSLTTLAVPSYLLDNGSTFGAGTATHSLTLYRHPSGALVFGAGTIRWSWGLDNNHDFDSATPHAISTADIRVQQATVNLLADMGAQPANLASSLHPALPSTDITPPVASVLTPASGASIQQGATTTISGSTSDVGGIIAGVEVSVDGGATWRPALLNGSAWSLSWIPVNVGTTSIVARAIDDSANLGSSSPAVPVTISPQDCTISCSIWGDGGTPQVTSGSDLEAVELGLKFRTDVAGKVVGVKFYKGQGNTGPHVGNLWTENGVLLATASFTNETATGWQQVNFSSPVAITANTTYVVSYHAPGGAYASDSGYFSVGGIDAGLLHGLSDLEAAGNGVYAYGPNSLFPEQTYNSTNYWVDILFSTGP